MNIRGYNTLKDNDNADYIEDYGPFKCTRNNAWLGHGYYFWDEPEDMHYAHQWGINSCNNDYIICSANLNLPNILDLLGNTAHMRILSDLLDVIKKLDSRFKRGLTLGEAIIYLMEIRKDIRHKNIFEYDSVRAADFPIKDRNPIKFTHSSKTTLNLNPRVQICVFNKGSTITDYKIVYPDKYL